MPYTSPNLISTPNPNPIPTTPNPIPISISKLNMIPISKPNQYLLLHPIQ